MSLRASSFLARAGMRIADACERWFSRAFAFALAAVIVVFGGGLALGERPVRLVEEFGVRMVGVRAGNPTKLLK